MSSASDRARRFVRAHGLWLIGAALVALPVLLFRYIPAQDYPEHLAAIRVVHSLSDPQFGLSRDFVLSFGRTNCLFFYVLGSALAYVTGVWCAGKLLCAACVATTFLGVRALALALRRDERVALFSIPLLYGPLFVLGLLPFLCAVSLSLWTIAIAIRALDRPTLRNIVALLVMSLLLSQSHPLPYAVFLLALAGHLARGHRLLVALAIAPSVVVFIAWLVGTAAGDQVRSMFSRSGGGEGVSLAHALVSVATWTVDAFRDRSDECFGIAMLAVAVAATVLGCRQAAARPRLLLHGLAPIGCAIVYLFGEWRHGYTAPLSQRYALIATLLVLPLLRFPRGRLRAHVTAALLVVGLGTLVNVVVHFERFDREAGNFDQLIAHIAPRRHVAALIFDSESTSMRFFPFLHFAAYYQVARGGVVKFSFVGYNHWPIDFRDGRYPPPGAPAEPGWEFRPRSVSVSDEPLPYYDAVITRGAGFAPPLGTFERRFESGGWSLWERSKPRPAAE